MFFGQTASELLNSLQCFWDI